MARPTLPDGLNELSVSERIVLVQQLWDSIAAEPRTAALTAAQRAELDDRLAYYEQHPKEGYSWEEVKRRLRRDV